MRLPVFLIPAGIVLVCLLLISGCTTSIPPTGNASRNQVVQDQVPLRSANGSSVVFNESDNGKTYVIPVDTEFTINLTESFATGTKWHASISPGIRLLDDNYYANPKSVRFDVGGTRSWHLLAAGPGQQSFHAGFFFEGVNETPQKSYTLALQVLP